MLIRRGQYTIIDWVQGQQQFCLNRERIRSRSNKTAVVQGASL